MAMVSESPMGASKTTLKTVLEALGQRAKVVHLMGWRKARKRRRMTTTMMTTMTKRRFTKKMTLNLGNRVYHHV